MPSPNRRTFVKGLTSALALGAVGSATGHPSFDDGHDIHRHDETIRLRDRLPSGWKVVGGDPHTAYDTGDGLRVEFDNSIDPTGAGSETRTLFVTVAGLDAPQVGPVQFSAETDPSRGGKDWETVAGTVRTSLIGPSQP